MSRILAPDIGFSFGSTKYIALVLHATLQRVVLLAGSEYQRDTAKSGITGWEWILLWAQHEHLPVVTCRVACVLLSKEGERTQEGFTMTQECRSPEELVRNEKTHFKTRRRPCRGVLCGKLRQLEKNSPSETAPDGLRTHARPSSESPITLMNILLHEATNRGIEEVRTFRQLTPLAPYSQIRPGDRSARVPSALDPEPAAKKQAHQSCTPRAQDPVDPVASPR